jgi:hypothetical protein
MTDFEMRRQEQIARNKALLHDLGLEKGRDVVQSDLSKARPAKRRKIDNGIPQQPSRRSGRLAAAPDRPVYVDQDEGQLARHASRKPNNRAPAAKIEEQPNVERTTSRLPQDELDDIRAGWSSWTASQLPPTRDTDGVFVFPDQPTFQPNKSPEEIIREGCFGGSYFRPIYSKTLGITVSDDWKELPAEWVQGLSTEKFLTSPTYDPEINKYGVACGQSIEEWEAAGWINHRYDVRGWFQWYCRFFQGRRCEDDERQISRWRKCVGETGRWRRILLKKYVALGIRTVAAEEDQDEDAAEVSPVVHQTCHHWAWEVRQHVLDRFFAEAR